MDAAIFLAGDEGINRDVVAETLVPRVIYHVISQAAADEERRALTMVSSTVALTSGNGALPVTALVKYMKYAAVADPLDAAIAKKMRWARSWDEFIRPLDSTWGYFIATQVSGASKIYYTVPGTAYSISTGYTGNISVTMPQIPTLPAAAGTAISVPGEIEQDLVLVLAKAIKGEAWMSAEAAT